jgi:hypothetical protein
LYNFALAYLWVMHLLIITALVSAFFTADVEYNNQDPVVQFWTWFQLNEKKLQNYDKDPARYIGEIHTQLQKIAPGLAVEGEATRNGIRNITITADGDETLFPIVQELVKKSPKLSGWNFIAFRQRVDFESANELSIRAGDIELAVKDMKFFPVREKDSLDIIIYVKGITEDNYMEVAYHGLILLDNLLGEYDCVMKVRSYDFHPMPAKKEELAELKALITLPAYLDRPGLKD